MAEWQKQEYAPLLEDKTLIIALESTCLQIDICSGAIRCKEVNELICDHEEADTRMMYHLKYVKCVLYLYL